MASKSVVRRLTWPVGVTILIAAGLMVSAAPTHMPETGTLSGKILSALMSGNRPKWLPIPPRSDYINYISYISGLLDIYEAFSSNLSKWKHCCDEDPVVEEMRRLFDELENELAEIHEELKDLALYKKHSKSSGRSDAESKTQHQLAQNVTFPKISYQSSWHPLVR